jgi:hypothetical protein
MVDTNQRTDNEEWLFQALTDLEDVNLLGGFCRHVGLALSADASVMVETVWPAVRARYQQEDGTFNVSAACLDLLSFPPMLEIAGQMNRPPGEA